jgi:hypothetical protein
VTDPRAFGGELPRTAAGGMFWQDGVSSLRRWDPQADVECHRRSPGRWGLKWPVIPIYGERCEIVYLRSRGIAC